MKRFMVWFYDPESGEWSDGDVWKAFSERELYSTLVRVFGVEFENISIDEIWEENND